MSRDNIIAMAREAGFAVSDQATDEAIGRFARFAALVVAATPSIPGLTPLNAQEANALWTECLKKHKRPGPAELIREFCGITAAQKGGQHGS